MEVITLLLNKNELCLLSPNRVEVNASPFLIPVARPAREILDKVVALLQARGQKVRGGSFYANEHGAGFGPLRQGDTWEYTYLGQWDLDR